jgi:hypothetical protein
VFVLCCPLRIAETRFGVPLTIEDMRLQTNQCKQLNLPAAVFQSSQKHNGQSGPFGLSIVTPVHNTVKTLGSYKPEMKSQLKSKDSTGNANANANIATPIGLQPVNPLLRESHARTRRKALAHAVLKYAKKCMNISLFFL